MDIIDLPMRVHNTQLGTGFQLQPPGLGGGANMEVRYQMAAPVQHSTQPCMM